MPGRVERKGPKWVVIWGGKQIATHDSERAAKRQLKALYAKKGQK